MRTIEFTAQYKMGHVHLKCKTTMAARNVTYIQDVPAEVPEHADGVNSTVGLMGQTMMCLDKYDDLAAAYAEAMGTEE